MMVFLFRNCFVIIVRKRHDFPLAVSGPRRSRPIYSVRLSSFDVPDWCLPSIGEPPSCKLLLVIRKGTLSLPSVGAKPRSRRLARPDKSKSPAYRLATTGLGEPQPER